MCSKCSFSKRPAILATSISAVLLMMAAPGRVSAVPAINTFNGTGSSWNVDANWTDGVSNLVPTITDAVLINGTSLSAGPAETLDASYSIQTLSFDLGSSSVSINASSTGTDETLALNGAGGGTDALGNSNALIDLSSTTTGIVNIGATSGMGTLSVALAANGVLNVGNAAATLNFGANSVISGSFNLSQTGSGTLVLAGANTFGGSANTFTLGGGTLEINNASALGNSSNRFIINGGTIDNTSGAAITASNYAQTWGGNFAFNGSFALNLGTGAISLTASRTVTVNGSAPLTVGGGISGTGFGLTKAGPGTMILTGANSYTGATTISGGALTYSGTGGFSGNTGLTVAGTGAVLNMNSTGTLTFSSVAIGTSSTAPGALYQTSGTINPTASSAYVTVGSGGYGYYSLSGTGNLNVTGTSGARIGFNAGGQGAYYQSGGTSTMSRYFAIGGGNSGAVGVATITGGKLTGSTGYGILVGDTGSGTLNLGTEAGGNGLIVSQSSGAAGSQVGVMIVDNGGGTGTLNLNSGTLQLTASSIQKGTGTGTSTLNFNGGVVQAGAAGLTLVSTGLSKVNVYNGGAIFDTQAYSGTIVAANLASAAGNGIYPAGGVLSIANGNSGATGGSGYIGAPNVSVSGGHGSGAMAIANVSNGAITGVTLTSPGQNYQVGDVLTFNFAGGGASTAGTFSYTLTAADVAANSAGGVTVKGSGAGAITFSGANTYTGTTTVAGGALIVGGAAALGSGPLNMTGGALNLNGYSTAVSSLSGPTSTSVIQNASATAAILSTGSDNTSTTYGAVLADGTGGGTLGLTKVGTGALTLSGVNTYTSATSINSGVLNVTGSLAAGTSVTVASSAALGGSGIINGSVTVNSGGVLSPGYQGTGVLGIGGNLTIGASSSDLATLNIIGSSSIAVTGTLTLNGGAGSVAINVGGAAPSVGEFPLISYGSLAGTGYSAFVLGTLPNRVMANLVNDTANGSIDLSVTGVDYPIWTGARSGEWSSATLAGPKNWVLNSNHSSTTDYLAGDTVLFDDSATGTTTVNISAADVSPSAVTFANNTLNYTLTGAFGITGSTSLTKTGSGLLTISNTNSFTGNVSISSGIISVASVANRGVASPLGAGTAITFDLGMLSFTGTSGSTNRDVIINSGGAILDTTGNLALTGVITGTGLLQKINSGALTLSGINSFSGGVSLNAGQLNINSPTALGTGAFTVGGGSIDNTSGAPLTLSTNNAQTWSNDFVFVGSNSLNLGAGAVTLSNNRTLTINASTLTVGGVISGSAGLTKDGNGTLLLSAANAYTGMTNVVAGVLQIGNVSAIPTSSAITISSGATFDTNAIGQGGRNVLTISGNGAPGQLGAIVNTNSANEGSVGNVTLAGDASVGGAGGKLDFYGTISGSATLTVPAGTTTVDVRTTNAISGLTGFVMNSPVIIEASQNWAGPYTVNNGGALGGYNSITLAGSVTLNGGTLFANGSNFATTFSGPIILQSDSTIGSTAIAAGSTKGGSNLLLSGTISGPGRAIFGGAMTTTLSVPNAYTGGTTITGTTTVVAGASGVLGSGGLMMSGGTFNLNGNDTAVPNLSSTVTTATIQNANANPATLTVGSDNSSTSYTSTLADGTGGGLLGLTKNGAGMLTLGGTNTYTGATSVNGGSLVVSGSIRGSTTTVNGGIFGGSGTAGVVNIAEGGTFAPGPTGSTGVMSTKDLTFSGGTFALDINTSTATSGSAIVTGNLSLGFGGYVTLSLSDLGSNAVLPAGDTFTLISYTGSWDGNLFAFGGTPIAENGTFSFGANVYRLTYDSGTPGAENVVLAVVPVPEPGVLPALFGGLGMLASLQKFRRRRA